MRRVAEVVSFTCALLSGRLSHTRTARRCASLPLECIGDSRLRRMRRRSPASLPLTPALSVGSALRHGRAELQLLAGAPAAASASGVRDRDRRSQLADPCRARRSHRRRCHLRPPRAQCPRPLPHRSLDPGDQGAKEKKHQPTPEPPSRRFAPMPPRCAGMTAHFAPERARVLRERRRVTSSTMRVSTRGE